jgi:hypothetical protein
LRRHGHDEAQQRRFVQEHQEGRKLMSTCWKIALATALLAGAAKIAVTPHQSKYDEPKQV